MFGSSIVFLQSCQKDNITTEFQKYVDVFLAEGAKRGQKLHADNLTVRFNPDKNGASQSIPGSPKILINKTFWEHSDDLQKESLIFHELGHAILGLAHNNCQLSDGSSASIMCGIGGSCITNYCFSPYGGMRREYYLDQLFDRETPIPQWSKLDEFKDEYLNKQRILVASEDFNDISNLLITGKYTSDLTLSKLNIDGDNVLRFKNFSKIDINQENVEAVLSFKIVGDTDATFIFSWLTLPDKALYHNSYDLGITNKKEGAILGLSINGTAGYQNNIDNYIKPSAYNQLTLRKIGNMYYFYLNDNLLFIQDFVSIQKEPVNFEGQDITGGFLLQTRGKCSFDYVKVNKIIL